VLHGVQCAELAYSFSWLHLLLTASPVSKSINCHSCEPCVRQTVPRQSGSSRLSSSRCILGFTAVFGETQDLEERLSLDMAAAAAGIKDVKVLTVHGTGAPFLSLKPCAEAAAGRAHPHPQRLCCECASSSCPSLVAGNTVLVRFKLKFIAGGD
jgi:hypothetical protein